jgi:hypothetical protein
MTILNLIPGFLPEILCSIGPSAEKIAKNFAWHEYIGKQTKAMHKISGYRREQNLVSAAILGGYDRF